MSEDSMGLTYDDSTVAAFVADRTGLDLSVVGKILHARDEYLVGLEIYPPDVLEDAPPLQSIRALAPALFRPEHISGRVVSPPLERTFVVMRTNLSEEIVRSALDMVDKYIEGQGIAVPMTDAEAAKARNFIKRQGMN